MKSLFLGSHWVNLKFIVSNTISLFNRWICNIFIYFIYRIQYLVVIYLIRYTSSRISFTIHAINIKISLSPKSMTSIVHCLYSNYHFCTSQERYVFFESLFHIKFVGLNLFFILHVIDLLLNIYRDTTEKLWKLGRG